MSFPPSFLEELRHRLPVSEVVGKKLRLIRKGREFLGLCPFHGDSKPSLSIVDEKQFYHCFACGAHGDIIKFVMETEGLSFPETVEKLAGQAGLEVPRDSPERRQEEARRKTLHDAMEAACHWFEEQLHAADGRNALAYLKGRALTDETIAGFRLGYAPERRGALRQAMAVRGVGDDLLVEGGLLKRSEHGDDLYEYFRGRVLFPITDRRGRVIAFGGRILGDGQPKYLNSPDTDLFHKGRVLYGLAQAREAAAKSGELILAEGYMDVIALAQAGFRHTVAPLGTALTEDQIAACWKLAPEPVLCFDGDEAGRRAAARAAERALPILEPGRSLRFVALPDGADPDDVVRNQGTPAMQQILAAAEPLAEFLWRLERDAAPVDTPERRADFHTRMREAVRRIADRTVQDSYRDFVERRIREEREANWQRRSADGRGPRRDWRTPLRPAFVPRQGAHMRARAQETMPRRQQQTVVATLINHPDLADQFGEALGLLTFADPFLDKLRQQVIEILAADPGLDAAALKRHLTGLGHSETVSGVLGAETLGHAGFARSEASLEEARTGLSELLGRLGKRQLEAQLADAQRAVSDGFEESEWLRLTALRQALSDINSGEWLDDADQPRLGGTK